MVKNTQVTLQQCHEIAESVKQAFSEGSFSDDLLESKRNVILKFLEGLQPNASDNVSVVAELLYFHYQHIQESDADSTEREAFQSILRMCLINVLAINADAVSDAKKHFSSWCDSEEESLIAAQDSVISHAFYEATAPRCFVNHAIWRLHTVMEQRQKGPFEDRIRHFRNNQKLEDGVRDLQRAVDQGHIDYQGVIATMDRITKSVDPGSFPHRLFKNTRRQVDDHLQHTPVANRGLVS